MFDIRAHHSTVTREVLGGLTTFMAMSYIIFVQPTLLSKTGMDFDGVMIATCVSSAIACFLMALLANYPVALAPGMGQNFFFVHSLVLVAGKGFGLTWQAALAMTFIAGMVFLALGTVGFRSMVLNAIPDSLKSGIAAGIGLFIALIGLRDGNLVIKPDGPLPVALADMRHNPVAWLALIGLAVTLVLLAFRIRGSILLGILATTAAALGFHRLGWVQMAGVTDGGLAIMGVPAGWTSTAGQFVHGFGEIAAGWAEHWAELLTFLFILLFMDIFDTVGTLVGVASRADMLKNGRLLRAERALAADAAGTIIGAALGTSTVTSYVESVAGVAEGARTGLAAIVTGALMIAALWFQPLVKLVGGGVGVAGLQEPAWPMLTAALVVVGAMMMRTLREIDWDSPTEYLPGFLTMVGMAFTYNISHGIAIGFVSYASGKLLTGKPRQCPALVYVFAVLFILRYAFMPA